MTVVSGSASAQSSGSRLNITAGNGAVLQWSSFNIGPGQTTTFIQPSANSVVLNTIGGSSPSQIWGHLTANGTVVLANAYGFYFGPNSMIKVGGNFVATTAPLPPDLGLGASWQFTVPPPAASIVNYGEIQAGVGQSLFLISEQIDNHGSLNASGGTVGLYAGGEVMVSERADGRGLGATVRLPAGSIDNTGAIRADAGTIALDAQVVNQNGLIQADSVRSQNGVIELVASSQLTLGPDSQILARGDGSAGGSPGGQVTIQSGGDFSDSTGSEVSVAGGSMGGNGGQVEISAQNVESLNTSLNGSAQAGWKAGELLLDPTDITLGTSAANGDIDVNTAFVNFSTINLQASDDITIAANTTWNLSTSTGNTTGQLTLQAGNNIIFNNNSQITDANNWSVTLQAGANIFLNGSSGGTFNGTVQTAAGGISMTAGQSILVGSGAIYTTGGGSITLDAVAGDINAGTGNDGYQFSISGATPSATPGQIATVAGGNITLTAGDDIISTPTTPSGQAPGATGAYGSAAGNVTLNAGNQVLGNYTVANGTGTINAGDVGSSTRPVALSLVSGLWNVVATDDVTLSEIRNPNGTFNPDSLALPAGQYPGNLDGAAPARSAFLFDYAANASASIWAGNSITLTGDNLPRTVDNQTMPPIYPPILSLNAGAGGITLDNSILIFPSPQGALSITTRGGGDLSGQTQQTTLTSITMSDSGLPGWSTFAGGHAVTPLHLNDPNPVTVDISGDIDSFGLTAPTFADVTVAGDAYNFGFLGQNLSPSQTTQISVTGGITYRGDLTSVTLSSALPAALFNLAASGDAQAVGQLQYDAATGTLTFIGPMSQSEEQFLLNPYQVVVNPTTGATGTLPIALTAVQQQAIQQLFTASQTASLGDQGLALAGPGQFNISAQSLNLGISGGITVLPPDAALAAISTRGANLSVQITGDLEMTTSQIANQSYLGAIQINVGGTLDVGNELTAFGDPNAPKGIYTTSGGAVTVAAGGDINVDGSRIAAYDGGNISVNSAGGSVNAGSGSLGYVGVQALYVNSAGDLVSVAADIPGSGILSTTVAGSPAGAGNITVDAPHGNVLAEAGGIVLIPYNGSSSGGSLTINASGDVNSTGSGIINFGAGDTVIDAANVYGLIVTLGTAEVTAQHNVSATVFAGLGANVSAGGTVAGTVISGGAVEVSGDSITAALVGESVAASGNTSTAAIGLPASNAPKDDVRTTDDASSSVASADQEQSDDQKKKKGKVITLAQKSGRVTVLLPPRKQ
jgi:filamentous hemagglutinin family protein